MSIELTTKSFGTEKSYLDTCCEQPIDSDLSLPDYCPDIMRILKCTVQTDITSSKIVGDRASADGNAKITVIYADEKNTVCSYRADYPFSKYTELASAYDGIPLICSAKTDYVNCRAVSKRRIDIHGIVSICFRICGADRNTLISSASGDGIQLKRKGIDISSAAASVSKCFQLSSVEAVGETMPGIGKVINSFAAPIISETKTIKGKLLIKGELAVRIIYCSDSENGESAVLGCSLPFSEVAEASDFSDSCRNDIKLCVRQLNAEPKTDNDGEYRYMNINAEICAYITAYESDSVSTVTDAYSTQTEINADYSISDFAKITDSISDIFSVKQELDISSLNPQKIYAAILSEPESKCTFRDGKMTVKGKIPVSLILIDSEGSPVSCEREAEFEYSHPVNAEATDVSALPQTAVSGFSCSLNSGGKAEFKAEINLSATVFSHTRERVLTSLSVSDDTCKKEKKSSLTVYFCSGNESVWDIARRYNTTVEEIMEENGLNADYLENKTMLMIPIK